MRYIFWLTFFCGTVLLMSACKKGYLDVNPNLSLAIPESMADFQSLLDNNTVFSSSPTLQEISADNYYVTYPVFQAQPFYYVRNCYEWEADTYAGGTGVGIIDWNNPYSNIYVANVVLQGLSNFKQSPSTMATWNNIEGQALFIRAFNLYNLAQVFALPYDSGTASTDLGIPLQITADLDAPVTRASVSDTYSRVLNDLLQAKDLLPPGKPASNLMTRPMKTAVYAMLARVYLAMKNYRNASRYADSCLSADSTLLDYNLVSTAATPSYNFPLNNPEIIMINFGNNYNMYGSNSYVDTNLYSSYDTNDLRKAVFYKPGKSFGFYFRGSYAHSSTSFTGMTVDEVFLIRAECSARLGDVNSALVYLNSLLLRRWKKGTFRFFIASNADDALDLIVNERRKELCFRGLRWTDLRRLNQDPRFAVTLTRVLNGVTYTLPPKDKRYTLLIPADEMRLANIPQTPRD